MSQERVARPDLDAWLPTQLQFVAFPMTPPVAITRDWWREATGEDPAESVKRPHEKTETGRFDGVALSVTADLIKISWTMAPRIEPGNPPLTIPTLDSFIGSRDRFVELMRGWISKQYLPIKRLGFGTVLIQNADSHADAYRLLGLYLPAVDVDPESFDFLYRVNRKRTSKSGIPNLQINRVSVWSAAKFSAMIQTMNMESPMQQTSTPFSEVQYKVVLNLDVNSDTEREIELPPENRDQLFEELVDQATEMATLGDTK